MTDAGLSEREFEVEADKALRALDAALSEVAGVEVDLESGILTVEFEDGLEYVVNSHRAARQIWMAAERTAWHFDYLPAERRWVAAKTGDELWSTLEAVIGRKLGRKVVLAAAK